MTHFRALVISDDLEGAMFPYEEENEELFTENSYSVEEYKEKFIKESKEEEFLKGYEKNGNGRSKLVYFLEENYYFSIAKSEEEHKKKAEEYDSHCLVVDDELVGVYDYYNDNAKYDWYCVAGDSFRYNEDDIIFKDGNPKNHTIGNLDIDAMIEAKSESARQQYRNVVSKLPNGVHESFTPLSEYERYIGEYIEIDSSHEYYTHDDAVEEYQNQPYMEAFREDTELKNIFNPALFAVSEEEYVKRCSIVFPVIVTDEAWNEYCESGWWGMTKNEKEAEVWVKTVHDIIAKKVEEDPNMEFTLCDCHI